MSAEAPVPLLNLLDSAKAWARRGVASPDLVWNDLDRSLNRPSVVAVFAFGVNKIADG